MTTMADEIKTLLEKEKEGRAMREIRLLAAKLRSSIIVFQKEILENKAVVEEPNTPTIYTEVLQNEVNALCESLIVIKARIETHNPFITGTDET